MRKASFWLMLFFCLIPAFLFSQNYPIRHFTMRDGLPSMAIRCIYKDTRGLMWIGTDAGLCSFDGKAFRIFKASEGMTANQIWAIAEDEDGTLWFGSFGEGLYKFDGSKFKRYTHKEGLVSDRIRTLCYSKNFHCLVVGSEGGVSTIKGDVITTSAGDTFSRKNGNVVTGLADAGKFIYVTTYGSNNPLRYYPDKNEIISLGAKWVHGASSSFSVSIDSKGDTIFSYGNGVMILKKSAIVRNDSMDQVFGISEDKRGDLWFASWSYPNRGGTEGIFRYDGKTFRNFKEDFGITDKEIWTLFCDKQQDILWVGTLNEGLFKVINNGFENFPASYFHLQNQLINDIFLDSENSIWISGNRELIRMFPNGSFIFLNKHPMLLSFRQFWNNRNQKDYSVLDPIAKSALQQGSSNLPGFEMQTDFDFKNVLEEPGGSVYFTNLFGLFNYRNYRKKTEYLGPYGIFGDFALIGNDTLLTTQWGPTRFMPDFRKNFSKNIYLPNYFFSKVGEASKNGDPWNVNRLVKQGNRFWYATQFTGLWMSEGMGLVHFNESDSTISNNLNDVCFDEKGHVIFGSNTGEICIAAFANKKMKIEYKITNEQGLLGSSISWLVADQRGKLWVGSNLGLNCIDLNELYLDNKYVIRFLDEEEGYTGQTSRRAVMDQQGKLWIGAKEQLIGFDTKDYLADRIDSGKIFLKSIEINHLPIDSVRKTGLDPWTSLPSGSLSLKHSENNLVFYYDILNYNNPEKDMFRYKLHGYDKAWVNGSAGRKAVYTNLPPGKYTFCVESINLSTRRVADPLILEFSIRHPLWMLWYFQVLLTSLLMVMAVLLTRKYSQAERRKQLLKLEIETKMVELEMQALQAQMNPHFIFNCVSGIQYFILANKKKEVMDYLSDFSKVVRESLTNATLRMIPLAQETEFLHSYLRLEQMRFPDKFDYEISCLDRLEVGFVQLPPMLVQPFAENTIRHGFTNLERKGYLTIVFETAGTELLKCTVTDNGNGRCKMEVQKEPSSQRERLHSTSITETRIRLFNLPGSDEKYKIIYTDLCENSMPCGLKVELYLPMEKASIEAQ